MQLRLDSLFGRLFGVLLLAIVLAHLLAFAWFFHYDQPPPPGPPPEMARQGEGPRVSARPLTTLGGPGSAARWCR